MITFSLIFRDKLSYLRIMDQSRTFWSSFKKSIIEYVTLWNELLTTLTVADVYLACVRAYGRRALLYRSCKVHIRAIAVSENHASTRITSCQCTVQGGSYRNLRKAE